MQISVPMARGDGSRMKKPCDCCKRYLDHLDEKNQPMSYFFRRMDANSKQSLVRLIPCSVPTYIVFSDLFYMIDLWELGSSK